MVKPKREVNLGTVAGWVRDIDMDQNSHSVITLTLCTDHPPWRWIVSMTSVSRELTERGPRWAAVTTKSYPSDEAETFYGLLLALVMAQDKKIEDVTWHELLGLT